MPRATFLLRVKVAHHSTHDGTHADGDKWIFVRNHNQMWILVGSCWRSARALLSSLQTSNKYHLIKNINHGRHKIDEKLASRSRSKNDFPVRHSSRLSARTRKDARTERTRRQQR
jgi:hypothetical protein